MQPVIAYEASKLSRIVFKPHPVIAPACDLKSRVHQIIHNLSIEELKTVSPPTLLFQPPLKNIIVHYGHVRVPGSPAVTFGAIVEGFEKERKLAEKMVSLSLEYGCDPEPYNQLLDGTDDSISIVAYGALSSNANCVKIAREAME